MKHLLICILSAVCLGAMAQTNKPFDARLSNDEYKVYLVIDFYHNDVMVPGQEIFGTMAGFLGDEKDGRKWFITEANLEKSNTANISIINDYGSEDLTATLTLNKDGSYTLKQQSGSTLKIARNRKWVKLPKQLVFKRQMRDN